MIRVSSLVVAIGLTLVASSRAAAQAEARTSPPAQAPSTPDDENTLRAREAFQVAVSLYGAGRYLEAAREFQRSYELSHEAGLLRNLYLALRDAGDVRGARTALRGYLDAGAPDTTEDDRRLLQHRLEALDRAITTTDPPAADSPVEAATSSEDLADPTTDETPIATAPSDDAWIWALVIGGVVLVGGGVALAVAWTTPGPGLDGDVPGRIETLTLASGTWSAP